MSDPFSRLAARMDAITVRKMGKTASINDVDMTVMGMDINAWLVSRSLWNAEQSQDVETLCASVITTWSYDALGAGAEMVLSLSGMGAIENAGDLEHEVLTPEKS